MRRVEWAAAATLAAAAAVAAVAATTTGAAGAWALPPLVDGAVVHPAWRVLLLPQQKPPPTLYAAETVDGRAALRMDARASYGNLAHDLASPRPAPKWLQWAWRMQQPNPAADLGRKSGDDVAAKVCLGFDLPLAGISASESAKLRLARWRSGEKLPAATLCWVWAGPEPRGSLVANAFTRRVRYLVLRNADDGVGHWLEESRDIEADFRRTFADELAVGAPLPPLVAVLVGADADNTGAHTLAHLAALHFSP